MFDINPLGMKMYLKDLERCATAPTRLLPVRAPAAAHHSTSAFDSERVVKIEGEVTQFRWINPHASIKIDGVTEGDDVLDGLWTVEMTAPNVLLNQGWKRSSLKQGDWVTIFVNPLRNAITLNDGSQGGLYVGVLLADAGVVEVGEVARVRGTEAPESAHVLEELLALAGRLALVGLEEGRLELGIEA